MCGRLGRRLLKGDSFIVVALYVKNTGSVTRYLVFQPDVAGHKVFYVKDVQDWKQPRELFDALFELYNLLSTISEDRPALVDTEDPIKALDDDLGDNFKDTFMSKRTCDDAHDDAHEDESKPAKRSRGSHGGRGGKTSNCLNCGEHVYEDHQVLSAFTRAGVTLMSNDGDAYGLMPLDRLRPTMRHAMQSDGTAIVAKMLRPGCNELQILQHLHSIQSPYNHTIPLLAALEVDMGTFIVLPEGTSLHIGFLHGMFDSEVVDFGQQLIEGVAFLHRNGIAHLDIKPQNIVAIQSQLYIIDFDVSVRVDGPSALMDRWRGTRGWTAPEMGDPGGPRYWYSPIRADLWSCGRMLLYLAEKGAMRDDRFEALTMQLLNRNPLFRPLLHEQSPVTAWHPLSELQGRLKRKRDTLPPDVKPLGLGLGLDINSKVLYTCINLIEVSVNIYRDV